MIKKDFKERSLTKIVLFLAFILSSAFFIGHINQRNYNYWKSERYTDLKNELEKVNFSKKAIELIFSDPRVKFYSRIVKKFRTARVPKLSAPNSRLLSKRSITEGLKFIKRNEKMLERVEKEYGVEKEIIVAILNVESRFGRIMGKYQAFGILNSIILYSEMNSKRSKWAKKQMVAFLILCRTLRYDPLEIKSSWAGAIGIPQFISTSYLTFAVDGNKDGETNLFNLVDASHSIANYLVKNGWRSNALRAIHSYNHSRNYVMGIKTYAEKLKKN